MLAGVDANEIGATCSGSAWLQFSSEQFVCKEELQRWVVSLTLEEHLGCSRCCMPSECRPYLRSTVTEITLAMRSPALQGFLPKRVPPRR